MNKPNKLTISELASRIKSADRFSFGNQLNFFLNHINKNPSYNTAIKVITQKHPFTENELDVFAKQLEEREILSFPDQSYEAAFSYQLLKYLIKKVGYGHINELISFQGRDFAETHSNLESRFITPIVNFLQDNINGVMHILYVLERYKARTEWFLKEKIFERYSLATSSYEKILEDDLRLYLFDQGIDYPFSTPHSASGRADIVSNLNTSEPLIIEIKIFDQQKKYGINRIKEGLIQILKYANDYNKNIAFLVLYNMDNVELDFDKNMDDASIFPVITYTNKLIYIVTINCFAKTTASQSKTMKKLKVNQDTLLN